MQQTTRVLINGDDQTVALPAEFHFNSDVVSIRRDAETGNVILSEEPKSFASFLQLLNEIGPAEPEFLAERDCTLPADRNLF